MDSISFFGGQISVFSFSPSAHPDLYFKSAIRQSRNEKIEI